ncbi:MAG TPA: nucleotidyltransferase domain-containing protein [Acidimicrobiales bacterium]|nr:nucleotidyltransferase domain-containing protein [Acidimicrobiales bacterium]
MDFAEPLQALIPGTTGRVLNVLVHTSMPLSGRAIAQLAEVSPAQAARVLPRLTELGLVKRRFAPPAFLYEFAHDHVAADPLHLLAGLGFVFLERLGNEIASFRPAPACVAVYGSFPRGQAHADSDIDLLVVRPETVDVDDEGWQRVVDTIRTRGHVLSGNRVEILEVGQLECRRLIRGKRPLWRNVVVEALVVHGPPLYEL